MRQPELNLRIKLCIDKARLAMKIHFATNYRYKNNDQTLIKIELNSNYS